MRRVGLLGGTFDPVHFGHLRSAVEVCEQLQLDELRLIPSARPPHRGMPGATAAQRLRMVELALGQGGGLQVDDRELQRERPSYTVETLESLRQELGSDVALFMVLGWDAFCGLPSWHRWESLLELANLVVLQRPDYDLEVPEVLKDLLAARSADQPERSHGQIICLSQTPLAISATHIRTLVGSGASPRFLLPDAVLDYIENEGLYRPSTKD
ncbi:nicotinate-nucleotide adenylyltransferase [Halopseudomonas aestusnigri]|jgi:nicotinate-nucleotide adenylyltransferase|uniref:nicotinate-nucleotide adenylyltransferase n=1 Tax=Halopseudomonas TaxID=2901189 RepID=UPI000C4D103E|nr:MULTISPECIES: nicotinate-nucleotide adenylyltransferase [Halopseudomonas]MAD27480.1 nicotinic acid mononucleotide adenylyltransferase [Pseudomonadales bacterium]HCP03728.1 nicotinic acid mononucleotide adenylyltransferase [Pseudomonas sp.]MAK73445.1 nicotinic acid mononucleotide adenylyltransferase [Pseudomonadales bacterium]MAS65981.1 nicotinic acid mononucleotide adenylyltransferase [Pseudomonadales bacterium]MCC4259551.1 nicotinate-nucleotide adenylyltransferase [Halopseudomonas aestusni|tara:strand:- start:521 stop:1159 length:639 start_codon:yes stop_codon:yes gene_type:complete